MRRAAALCSVVLVACGSRPPPAAPAEPRTRAQIEDGLRARLATIAAPCARATWIRRHAAAATGLEREAAGPIAREHASRCADAVAAHLAGQTPIDQPVVTTSARLAPPCTQLRADSELRRRPETPRPITTAMVDAVLRTCVVDQIAACQAALATGLDAAIACWDQQPWSELPASVVPSPVTQTAGCLRELKGVSLDLATCPKLAPTARADCVSPYVTYAPSCPPLDVSATWRALPGHEEIDRVVAAAAQREAGRTRAERAREDARLAAIAKETQRCHGHTTLDVAVNLKRDPTLTAPRGCRYQVFGKVIDHNNVFVQLVDPISAGSPHLLRTREPFAANAVVADRTATFEGTDQAEMADGSTRVLAVFALEPVKR